jgi:hypothetical protein
MEAKNLLEFRNNIHNFRNSIKFSMNFYRFKLTLARLKLIDNPGTIYVFLIFFEPRTYLDVSNKICFAIFRVQIKLVQIFEFALI